MGKSTLFQVLGIFIRSESAPVQKRAEIRSIRFERFYRAYITCFACLEHTGIHSIMQQIACNYIRVMQLHDSENELDSRERPLIE